MIIINEITELTNKIKLLLENIKDNETDEIIKNLEGYEKILDSQRDKIKKEIAGFTGLNKLKLPF
jgi:hypothetical protein